MKALPLIAMTLSLGTLATVPALAQTSTSGSMSTTTPNSTTMSSTSSNASTTMSNKPMVMQNTSDGKTVYILPPSASATDKYRASWIFNNLNDLEVKRWEAQGYSDSTIKGAANIAYKTGLSLEYVLQQVRVSGLSLIEVARNHGVTVDNLDSEVPGFGAAAISYASADINAPTPSYATTTPMSGMSSTTTTTTTGTAASASMPATPSTTPAPATPDTSTPAPAPAAPTSPAPAPPAPDTPTTPAPTTPDNPPAPAPAPPTPGTPSPAPAPPTPDTPTTPAPAPAPAP